jgi:endonuclease YncB( thermonuclease family)
MFYIRYKGGTLPDPWRGTCTRVFDGDTITVLHDGIPRVIRLYGCDAPENGQTGSSLARHFLRALALRQPCKVTPLTLDRYGRIVARVTNHLGQNLSAELIAAGWAWHESRYCPHLLDFAQLQKEARADRRGIWGIGSHHFAPWVWRRRTA